MRIKVLALLLFMLLCPCVLAQWWLFPGLPSPPPRPRLFRRLELGLNAVGPESVAFDCQGRGPYVGVSDGRILRWENSEVGWTEFAVTHPNRSRSCDGMNNSPMERYCGRPLGMKFHKKSCELYIADSSVGLVKVGRDGGVAVPLATCAEALPFRFLNDLDIDLQSALVYFTDTTSHFDRWNYELAIMMGDRSGRLMKYDINTGKVTVVLRDLAFANGVALSKNKDYVLVSETSASQITRLWLKGPKAGVSELFLSLYGGLPDNINRNPNGEFWIAQNPKPPIKVDEHANVLEVLNRDGFLVPSDIFEVGNTMWIGSVVKSYLVYAQDDQ